MKKLKSWKQFSNQFDLLLKRFEQRFLKYNYRRLSLATSGRLYVLFSIVLGVAAILSNNNLLFLLESFLLGGLILSGTLSEYAVSSVSIHWVRKPVFQNETCRDILIVKNNGKLPLLCIDVGEYVNNEFVAVGFIPILLPNETREVTSTQKFSKRGQYDYQGWAVETSYPFGFAKKMRWHDDQGCRIIWAQRFEGASQPFLKNHLEKIQKTSNYKEGEIEETRFDRDSKKIVFSKSLSSRRLYSRVFESENQGKLWIFDANAIAQQSLEAQISKLTHQIYTSAGPGIPHLQMRSKDKIHSFTGLTQCLNALATYEATP